MSQPSPLHLRGVKAVLLDIEGTISSLSFVKDVMYPYSLSALPSTLTEYFSLPTAADRAASPLAEYVAAFPEPAQQSAAALESHIRALVAADVKDTALKKLQGLLWKAGFDSGALQTPLFSDVEPFLRACAGRSKEPATEAAPARDTPLQLAIFSSGSVPAQKMFVSHVGKPLSNGLSRESSFADPPAAAAAADGASKDTRDLSSLFSAYFDTENAGPKLSQSSYEKIAGELGREPSEVLFLSDNVNEIRAALLAGMHAIVVDRPGNQPLSERSQSELLVIRSFEQLDLA